jgi:hypothetical protein
VTDDIAVAEFKKYTENNKIVNPEVVDKTVDLFKELIKYKVINPKDVPDGNPSDISYWKKKGWPSFYQFVQDKRHEYQIVKMSKPRGNKGNYRLVDELPDWLIVLPLDAEASCFAGKNTKLCVARVANGHFERYFYEEKRTREKDKWILKSSKQWQKTWASCTQTKFPKTLWPMRYCLLHTTQMLGLGFLGKRMAGCIYVRPPQ